MRCYVFDARCKCLLSAFQKENLYDVRIKFVMEETSIHLHSGSLSAQPVIQLERAVEISDFKSGGRGKQRNDF